MRLCGQRLGGAGLGWWGIVFDTQEEAAKVKGFLEKGIQETSKVDSKQTEINERKENEKT
jgi:hypothetical protein